ncbi:hypothetical protein WA026_014294 [Henosepilachna vigintioctopunctata]|uniref:Uncharacterized protein n=1 Tax=Henosepilachna vigintioctopunctata TaxID=420089 RepID=A0AAW1TU34_9CUCU
MTVKNTLRLFFIIALCVEVFSHPNSCGHGHGRPKGEFEMNTKSITEETTPKMFDKHITDVKCLKGHIEIKGVCREIILTREKSRNEFN